MMTPLCLSTSSGMMFTTTYFRAHKTVDSCLKSCGALKNMYSLASYIHGTTGWSSIETETLLDPLQEGTPRNPPEITQHGESILCHLQSRMVPASLLLVDHRPRAETITLGGFVTISLLSV